MDCTAICSVLARIVPSVLITHLPSILLILEGVLHHSSQDPQQRRVMLCASGQLLELVKLLLGRCQVTPTIQRLSQILVTIPSQGTAISLVEKATECLVIIVIHDDDHDM